MGFTELLTIIFVLLKVFGVVSWSWWVVFLPEIIALVLYIILFVIGVYAQELHRMYTSYINAGFTEEQAWELVRIITTNSTKRTLF